MRPNSGSTVDGIGINPWVAHFFVFFLPVWGELSPPTSLTAAVCARIANASFMRTMWEALKICLPITLLTFAIFTRSDLVVKPGWGQIGDIVVVSHNVIASPKEAPAPETGEGTAARPEDLDAVVAQARRDIG